MTGCRRAGAAALALSAAIGMAGCGEIFGDGPLTAPEGTLSFDNQRDDAVTVTYETTADQRNGRPNIDEIRLPAGERGLLEPTPLEDDCLVAPIVTRTDDGDEVDRLPTGYCLGEDLASPENQIVIR